MADKDATVEMAIAGGRPFAKLAEREPTPEGIEEVRRERDRAEHSCRPSLRALRFAPAGAAMVR